MSLRIATTALGAMHGLAEAGYPYEVCGILAGRRDIGGGEVSELVPLVNERADSPKNRYQVGPLLMMRAEEGLEERGLQIVGYYHSHPDHPSRYSDFDRDHALPNMSYTIISVVAGQVSDTASWRLSEDRSEMSSETIEEG